MKADPCDVTPCSADQEYEVVYDGPIRPSRFCARHARPWRSGEGSCPAEVFRLKRSDRRVGSDRG